LFLAIGLSFFCLSHLAFGAGDKPPGAVDKPEGENCGFAKLAQLAQDEAAQNEVAASSAADDWETEMVNQIAQNKFPTLGAFQDFLDKQMPTTAKHQSTFNTRATGTIKEQSKLSADYVAALSKIQAELGVLNNPRAGEGWFTRKVVRRFGGRMVNRALNEHTENGAQSVEKIREGVQKLVETIGANMGNIDRDLAAWHDELKVIRGEVKSWTKVTSRAEAQLKTLPEGQMKAMLEMMNTRALAMKVMAQQRLLDGDDAIKKLQLVRGNQNLALNVLNGPVQINIDGLEREMALAQANAPVEQAKAIAQGIRKERERLSLQLAKDIESSTKVLTTAATQGPISDAIQAQIDASVDSALHTQADYFLNRGTKLKQQSDELSKKIAAVEKEIAGREQSDRMTQALTPQRAVAGAPATETKTEEQTRAAQAHQVQASQ
jgi:hypothetical protein